MEEHTRLLETDPEYRKNRLAIERFTNYYIRKRQEAGAGLRSGIVRIPVVVHVIYNTSAQNITDAQIHSQIAVLNRDFRRLNADASSVQTAFQSVAADARIEFQLAVRDPSCNPTTGIIRRSTSVTIFHSNTDDIKSASTGGADPWPRDRYLNLWVAPNIVNTAGISLLGYAQFPGGPAATDGVVIVHDGFVNIGAS